MNQVEAFAAYLAGITDEDERARALARVKLLAVNAAPEEAFSAPIRTARDYLAADIEIPPVLIHPYMCVRGGINVTVGRAGKGKTVMNLNRMIRWSAGLPFFDDWQDKDGNKYLAPDEPLKVLIVENEGAAGMFHRQFGIMMHSEEHLPVEAREQALENCLIWGDGGYSHLKLDDPNKLNGLRRGIEEWGPDLVFIEPFRSLWAGEENSATEMQVVADALVSIATDYNCGVWFAHHEKKGGFGEDDKMSAARGSTVLEGVVTVMENFGSVKNDELRELSYSKSRYEVPPPPCRLDWDQENKWYTHIPSDQIEDEIILALENNNDEPMTVSELSDSNGETKRKLNETLKKMVKDGKVKKMAGVSHGGTEGSSGPRYRLAKGEASSGMDF